MTDYMMGQALRENRQPNIDVAGIIHLQRRQAKKEEVQAIES
jgi:hypothetical protein